jgi:predicted GNAT superfamily acetyltransferase
MSRAVDRVGSESAARQALAASRAAGVVIREITDAGDFAAMHRLFDRIWRPDPQNQPITAALMRALGKADNYVAAAFDEDELVGACVGFFGPPADATMHSHITGVSRTTARRGVGFALKTHQRSWAMRRGLKTISWTYDPLVSRNGYFNLAKLAATPVEYLANFYGGMNDAVNGSDDSDRLLVSWDLTAPAVHAACSGSPVTVAARSAGAAVIGLGRSPDGGPVPGLLDGATVLVAVPPDVESLRATDPGSAHAWRIAVREALTTLMTAGWRATGFDRTGWYVLTRGGGVTP